MRKILLTLALMSSGPLQAQDLSETSPFVGIWNLHSSGGYHGSMSLDGLGGCSYFVTSAFTSVQATCVVREISETKIMVFGTQEASTRTTPSYGEQLTNSAPALGALSVFNFELNSDSSGKLSGHVISAGRKERIKLWR